MRLLSAMIFKKILLYLPLACLAAFAVLYLLAAATYPGGHRHDPAHEGYSWVSNYFSDLFQRSAYNGKTNHGRSFALASLAALELTFLSFWVNLINFWHLGRPVRIAGNILGLALVFSLSLTVPYHAAALKLSMLIGSAGFICLAAVLYRQKERTALLFSIVFFTATAINFVLWATQYLEPILPTVQKFVLLAFAVWVVVLTMKVVRYNRNENRPEI